MDQDGRRNNIQNTQERMQERQCKGRSEKVSQKDEKKTEKRRKRGAHETDQNGEAKGMGSFKEKREKISRKQKGKE